MTNQLTGNINRTRELVRAGSYLGAIILGAAAGSALYTRSYTTAIAPTSMLPAVLGIAFVFLGAYLAWFIDDIVARAAWAVFAVTNCGRLLVSTDSRVATLLLMAGPLVFGALLVTAGTRQIPGPSVRFPAFLCIVVMVLAFAARYYADVLLGTRSAL